MPGFDGEHPLGEQLNVLQDELCRRWIKEKSAASKQKDKAVKAAQFSVGDRVLLSIPWSY
jgi:hypothetical protein